MSLASLARYLVGASPIETVRPVSFLTLSLILRAVSSGGPKSISVPVKSIKASSIDIC